MLRIVEEMNELGYRSYAIYLANKRIDGGYRFHKFAVARIEKIISRIH